MFKCPVHSAVNEARLHRLTPLIVLPLCLLLYEHPPQGCASKTALLFLLSLPPDLARRQSIQRRRKVLIWGGEKVLTREAWAQRNSEVVQLFPSSLSRSVSLYLSLLQCSWGERAVGRIFVLLCAHFIPCSPAEQGYAAWSERLCWNAYNALWKLWLLLI